MFPAGDGDGRHIRSLLLYIAVGHPFPRNVKLIGVVIPGIFVIPLGGIQPILAAPLPYHRAAHQRRITVKQHFIPMYRVYGQQLSLLMAGKDLRHGGQRRIREGIVFLAPFEIDPQDRADQQTHAQHGKHYIIL